MSSRSRSFFNTCIAFANLMLAAVSILAVQPVADPSGPQTQTRTWKERVEEEIQDRVGKIVPRKIKTRGKPKVARWEDVDAALADVQSKLDIGAFLRELGTDFPASEDSVSVQFRDELDQVLSRQPILYNQIFTLEDPASLFPLTNNVLRLVSDATLADLEVFDKTGFSLGSYVGKYVFEKSGGLASGNSGYRLTYFQYRDNEGNIRPSGTINLLDTYAVRWKEIKDKPGLVLTADLLLK